MKLSSLAVLATGFSFVQGDNQPILDISFLDSISKMQEMCRTTFPEMKDQISEVTFINNFSLLDEYRLVNMVNPYIVPCAKKCLELYEPNKKPELLCCAVECASFCASKAVNNHEE